MYSKDFADLEGTALVVGGSGGLGSSIVTLLAERGSRVTLTYRSNADAAQALIAAGDGLVDAVELDLVDASACVNAIAEVSERWGGIHAVVYASGPAVPMTYISAIEPDAFAEQMRQDTVAFFNLVKAVLPELRRSGGNLVAITTAATTRHATRDGLSSIPKAAVEMTVRALAREEGRFGIRANCVGPGMLTEGMAEGLIAAGHFDEQSLEVARRATPLRRFGLAKDIAEAACFLASPRANFISGQKLDVDGGYGI